MKNTKVDNNLYRVTDLKDGSQHWYTSLQRIANAIGIQRTLVMYACAKPNKTYKDLYKIELVDGSDITYKNIN